MVALTLSACSAPTPSGTPTPSGSSPDPSATATRTEPAKPALPRARRAVVSDGETIYLYDVKTDRLSEIVQGGSLSQPRFVSADRVAFVSESVPGGSAALRTFDLKTRRIETVFEVSSGIRAYDWSPTGTTIAFITHDELDFPQLRYRSLATGSTRSVATLARAQGRGISPDDQVKLEWTRNGRMLLVAYTFADGGIDAGEVPPDQSQLQVRDAAGDLVFAAEHADDPTQATWSWNQKGVYYRTADGAFVWDAEAEEVSAVPGGTAWFNPSPSPDRDFLAYDTGSFRAASKTFVLDLRTGATRQIGEKGRSNPVFASATVVWVQKVERCTDGCQYPAAPVNEVLAVNLRTGVEKPIDVGKLVGVDVLYA